MKKKIMIIDDEKDVRYTLKRILESENLHFEIIEKCSAKEALNDLEKQMPDLILLDVMMPDMDGWEACKKIKSKDKFKDIPVIFLTAKQFTIDDLQKATKIGATEYLTKPFEKEQLIKIIKGYLCP